MIPSSHLEHVLVVLVEGGAVNLVDEETDPLDRPVGVLDGHAQHLVSTEPCFRVYLRRQNNKGKEISESNTCSIS